MKLLLGLFALMLAVGLLAFLASRVAPSGPECKDRVLAESRSPEDRFIATSFERTCGAQVATAVGLRLSEGPFTGAEKDTVFVAPGQVAVRLLWREELQFVIESKAQAVAREESSWRKVQVTLRRLR